jgi:hypothetical protein
LKPSAPKGVDKFGTPAERAINEPDFRGLPTDTNALPPEVPGSTMELPPPAEAPDELDQFLMEQEMMGQGMGPFIPRQQEQPAPNEGAAFNNKLNYLNSMS